MMDENNPLRWLFARSNLKENSLRLLHPDGKSEIRNDFYIPNLAKPEPKREKVKVG